MFRRFVATVIIGGVWMLVGELLSIAQPVIAAQSCVPGTVLPTPLDVFSVNDGISLCATATCGWAGIDQRFVPSQEGDDITMLYARAQQDDADAQYDLGGLYEKGDRVSHNVIEAARWYHRAAAQGHVGAQFLLAILYERGDLGSQDAVEAGRWYRKAAIQGHTGAQFLLGDMYASGHGVPQHDGEAVRWYRQAAEQGHALAQFHLGLMYFSGRSLPQDDREAARWCRRAAEQGLGAAQAWLGELYATGRGVSQDNVQAHAWFNLAIARLPQGQKRDHVMQARDDLAAMFIPSQLARAQEIALSWHGQWEEAKGRSGASLGKTAQSQPAAASLPRN
jgi:TPR repeat protein